MNTKYSNKRGKWLDDHYHEKSVTIATVTRHFSCRRLYVPSAFHEIRDSIAARQVGKNQ